MIGPHLPYILKLYVAPFRYDMGYIFDAENNMVADEPGQGLPSLIEIRGWGNLLSKRLDPVITGDIQDEIGEIVAQALTEYWNKHKEK